jgi:hypothetical protein
MSLDLKHGFVRLLCGLIPEGGRAVLMLLFGFCGDSGLTLVGLVIVPACIFEPRRRMPTIAA